MIQYDGIFGGFRRVEQYTDNMLGRMLAAGAAPGGGNRSQVAAVFAHVGKEIHRLQFPLCTELTVLLYSIFIAILFSISARVTWAESTAAVVRLVSMEALQIYGAE